MSITLLETWGKCQRAWGWEVRADYDDGNGGVISIALPCSEDDDQEQLDALATDFIPRLEEQEG